MTAVQRAADTARVLSLDMIESAKSGHPGMPLGCADTLTLLYSEFLRHDPAVAEWPDRDRFVLSAGHGSALLYAVLHLMGYGITVEDMARYRSLGSGTPGHPEYGRTPGVEMTTGPLGQGLASAVGMALAEAMLAARFNRPGLSVVDHRTWVLCGDGDLMEGISSEAASLAGHLRLGKLKVVYDSNGMSIEGATALAFTEDVAARFAACGWRVTVADGHNLGQLRRAFEWALEDESRPSLVIARTRLAHKSRKEGDPAAHGAPLGPEEVAEVKRRLGFPVDQAFVVPPEVRTYVEGRRQAWSRAREEWARRWEAWSLAYPELRRQWDEAASFALPAGLEREVPPFAQGERLSTRVAGGVVLNKLARALPYLVGGSADLSPSTRTWLDGVGEVGPGAFEGRNLHFGVREHAMGAVLNGLVLHGGWRGFGSTFFVFSDYMRPAMRMAGLMRLPVLWIFTHDSVWVGEDGPTHQPVEHLEALRLIPGAEVWRPADAEETRQAWLAAIRRTDGPAALVLTRQEMPSLELEGDPQRQRLQAGVPEGAYVVRGLDASRVDVTLVATGSEVALALAAAGRLEQQGVGARVVSVPCRERFAAMPKAKRRELLAHPRPCVAVEAGSGTGWSGLVEGGPFGLVGIDRYGESGRGHDVASALGLTPEHVAAAALRLLAR